MSYSVPKSLDEALSIVQNADDFAFVAGGTDLIVRQTLGTRKAKSLIDLNRIPGMREIVFDGESLVIGAGVTLAALCESKTIRERFPTIREAALSIASPNIRTNATVGGNLLCENRCIYFDQSDFWRNAAGGCLKSGGDVCIATGGAKHCYSVFISDLTPVLICLGARVEFIDSLGLSYKNVEALYTGEGTEPHTLRKEAIITRIIVPLENEGAMFFHKVRPRESVDFTDLTLAMRLDNGALSLSASGIGPAPVVVRKEISDKDGRDATMLAAELLAGSQIIDNLSYQRSYRKAMVRSLIEQGLARLTKS